MPTREGITWFKGQFYPKLNKAVADTPFSVDLLVAIACQETGYIWQVLRQKNLKLDRILELCVGDTLDADKGRRAFPQTKADLMSWPRGPEMFDIARQALVDMAKYISGYQGAASNPNKFCHGFGIFQYDLQHFKTDPDFFLQKRYADFDASLAKCLEELHSAKKRAKITEADLTDYQMAGVAIAYNAGRFVPSRGLQQGHFDGQKYYGEHIMDFLRLSKTVPAPDGSPVEIEASKPGEAAIKPPTDIPAEGTFYEVDVQFSPLNLRSGPFIDENNPNANVIAKLPDGHIVRAVADEIIDGFREVETSLWGAYHRGFAHTDYLIPAEAGATAKPIKPDPTPPATGIVAVFMPRKPGTVTRRINPANAHSLNEPDQPVRQGASPDELRTDLVAIVDFLAVDNPQHVRYQPSSGLTFCNIYAHDYCHLAGVYLPRVWWSQGAIVKLTRGEEVKPLYGNTIYEMRANDLFRWLRDFGPDFGWRQTGTLDKLQLEVNEGAIGLIVARRTNDGKSGHIVAVVPETHPHKARRNGAGQVIAPLQSQAGANNFRYGTGPSNWWLGSQFAESAFWLHA
ncbi:MAG: hypothetical protein FJ135_08555 [Deltaproteobacteria bacterium]|nr:hypothetical protein [Deltaproteobacteria bacterium]